MANRTSSQRRTKSPTASSGRLQVSYVSLANLKENPRNPRQHDRRQIRRLMKSIETFGFNVPILINSAGEIVCGHGRALAARDLGWRELPAICLEHLTEMQARGFMIAENQLASLSSWDDKLLAEQLQVLDLLGLEFSIEATGFDTPEIDLRIESLRGRDDDKPDPADDLPQQSNQPTISKPGDIWLLGRHRVGCGNALESSSYAVLMQNDQAAVMFADPPFNVKVDGHASGLGSVRHREFSMAAGEMTRDEFTRFLVDFSSLCGRHSKDGSIHFICMDWRHIGELMSATRKVYSEVKNLCVWTKHNSGMGSLYRSQHELVLVLKYGRGRHRNNIELGKHGRHRSNIWSYRGMNDFGRGTDEGNLLALHPTVKPVALVADAILDCSVRGDIVLDPFLGSGTTVIAAERTGRRCYGLEIDPGYVDTVIRRWQAFTGDGARRADSGQTFNHIETIGGRGHVKTKEDRRR